MKTKANKPEETEEERYQRILKELRTDNPYIVKPLVNPKEVSERDQDYLRSRLRHTMLIK